MVQTSPKQGLGAAQIKRSIVSIETFPLIDDESFWGAYACNYTNRIQPLRNLCRSACLFTVNSRYSFLQPDFLALRRLQEGSNLRSDGRLPILEDVMTMLLMQLHFGVRKDLTPTLKEVHIEAEIFTTPDNLHRLIGKL
jgi:hypothetical protein